jgi:hypothetical protein
MKMLLKRRTNMLRCTAVFTLSIAVLFYMCDTASQANTLAIFPDLPPGPENVPVTGSRDSSKPRPAPSRRQKALAPPKPNVVKTASQKSSTSGKSARADMAKRRPGKADKYRDISILLPEFKRRYQRWERKRLKITCISRTPAGQARAIRKNLTLYGSSYVIATYRRKSAIRAVVAAYNANRRSAKKAVREMTRVIQAQVNRGVFISNHLRGLAVDVRSRGRYGARLSVLRRVAQSMGARVSVERDHYHVDLG